MSEFHAEGWPEKIRAAFWRHRRVHLVLLLWAVCYLPGLGSVEIKGEEGRRILPGITMLESGNYLVPHVGSEPYFRKPPLINWLVAASFKLTGVRNEWTARLPSALCILAVALAFVSVAAPSLGATGSFLAALIWLTFAGNLEKGRQIEIEALYVSLTALAFVCWMAAYRSGRTGLRLWLAPAIFLGLGILAKGPLPHLLFFYGPVIAILRRDGKLALLVTRAHFLALLITFGLFACWAVPAYLLSDSSHVAAVWGRQFKGRVTGQQFQFVSWVTAIPRSLVYLLPWLPFALIKVEMPAEERSSQRALLAGMTVPFVLVCLLPEAVPRFSLPVLGPTAWWFGELLRHTPWRFPSWLGARAFDERWRRRAVAATLVLTCLFMLAYAVVMGRHSQARDKIRKHARQIDLIVPANVPLYAVDPQYQPYLFYVHAPVHYVSSIDELPPETKFFLVQERDAAEGNATKHWAPRRPQLVLHIKDYREREAVLYSVPSP